MRPPLFVAFFFWEIKKYRDSREMTIELINKCFILLIRDCEILDFFSAAFVKRIFISVSCDFQKKKAMKKLTFIKFSEGNW